MPTDKHLPNVCMMGAGEYTTGFVGGGSSPSDKKIGVVALSFFDLRRRGLCGPDLSMVATDGSKHPLIKEHFKKNIEERYRDMDTSYRGWPKEGVKDREAYRAAIDTLQPGDAITIFTPDSTHFAIAEYALRRKIHVLVTKPAVQDLQDHIKLAKIAAEEGVLCYVEHHKRFDPAYFDAREKARAELGDPSYFYSYMSQPKRQLKTFAAWAGKDSDISYYLNSHHVDIFDWMTRGRARPVRVTASGSSGIAESLGCQPGTEDTITLVVDNEVVDSQGKPQPGKRATAVFTASWTAPEGAGVHSEQGFHYVGSKGEAKVNQSRRGYDVVTEEGPQAGARSVNPFYVQYAPFDGYFQGQQGYGTRSLEVFAQACTDINAGRRRAREYDAILPTIADTVYTTAILQAGRLSLDEKRSVEIETGADGMPRLV
ncbi:unnamed protein product [Parajaminaea phylloscopi]